MLVLYYMQNSNHSIILILIIPVVTRTDTMSLIFFVEWTIMKA